MTNLSQNIRKFVCIKAVDITEAIIFIFLMFFIISAITSPAYLLILLIMICVVFFIVQDKIKKKFDKWTVPILSTEENKKYLISETLFFIAFSIILFAVFFKYMNYKLLILVLIVVVLIKEIPKWYRFNKISRGEKNG